MSEAPSISTLSSCLTFGKYKGRTVREVFRENPSYLAWAHVNVPFFKLTPDLASAASDEAAHRLGDWWWWELEKHWDGP